MNTTDSKQPEPSNEAEREAGFAGAHGSAALVQYWTERRTRKLNQAKQAASKGDYATAMKETAEADATLLCLQDLYDHMSPNDLDQRTGRADLR